MRHFWLFYQHFQKIGRFCLITETSWVTRQNDLTAFRSFLLVFSFFKAICYALSAVKIWEHNIHFFFFFLIISKSRLKTTYLRVSNFRPNYLSLAIQHLGRFALWPTMSFHHQDLRARRQYNVMHGDKHLSGIITARSASRQRVSFRRYRASKLLVPG